MKSVIYRLADRTAKLAQRRSPWILHMDTGGCNGCSIETFALLNPRFDVERFGVVNKGNPRHTDILIIAGAVTKKVVSRLKRIYEQTPEPKVVVAMGACGTSCGVFHDAYNICGPLEKIMPVDVYIPGCPPKPEAVINGMLKALKLWKDYSL